MKRFIKIRKYLLLLIIMFSALFVNAANHVNFLPMEDNMSTVRNEAFGASVDNIRPYRQTLPLEKEDKLSESGFGSTDVLLFVLLIGVYVLFSRRKSASRNAGI